MEIIDLFRKIRDLEKNNFSDSNTKFKNTINSIFLDSLTLDNSKYRLKGSIGTGQFADMWWIGIFDINYYFEVLNVNSISQIGASKGYYVVYLFNYDRTKVYLTLAQASSGVTSNKENLNLMQEKNEFLQSNLFYNAKYPFSIDGMLSNKAIQMARDYEKAVILAKEYNLSSYYSNETFKTDLIDVLSNYEKLVNFLRNNTIFLTPSFIISNKNNKTLTRKPEIFDFDEYISNEKEQYLIQYEKPYNQEELSIRNNRSPRLIYLEKEEYYRDYRLAKTVLSLCNYQCNINHDHKTFFTLENHMYAEAHHLIPMRYQKELKNINLDIVENIFSLCPICHNAIHYGNEMEKINRIEILFDICSRNSDLLVKVGVDSYLDLFEKFYTN